MPSRLKTTLYISLGIYSKAMWIIVQDMNYNILVINSPHPIISTEETGD